MRLAELAPAYQWACLIALSLGLGALLAALRVPAAPLLGPLLSGIAFTALGGGVRLPRHAFALAQALIGCMIAKMLPALIGGAIVVNWGIFALGVLSVIGVSVVLGWLLLTSR